MVRTTKLPILHSTDLERHIEKEFRKSPVRELRPIDFAPPSVRAPDSWPGDATREHVPRGEDARLSET
jgi:hypothetical protein